MNNQTRAHYPALDGLRGVAILLVVFLHNFGFMNYFFFGWLGVDLFFVLSGFLITDILLNGLGQPDFLKNFYMRRLLRIFPLFYLALILCLFVLPLFSNLNIEYYQENQVWFWTYLQNWLFVFNEPYGDRILLHTWSLAVEEQFYLVWPATILLVKKPKALLAIVAFVLSAVIIARYVVWTFHIQDLAYSSLYTFTRIDGICIGCMLALLLRVNRKFLDQATPYIVLLMAAINFAFYFLNNSRSFSLPYLAFAGYTTFAVLFGLLVYEAVTGRNRVINFIFNNRVLKFFGRISYGLYVWHWPVYILLFPLLLSFSNNSLMVHGRTSEILSATLATLIAIVISLLSFRFFELPFLKLKDRYR